MPLLQLPVVIGSLSLDSAAAASILSLSSDSCCLDRIRRELFGRSSGYHGEPDKIYAPPRRNEGALVADMNKAELGLQRRREQVLAPNLFFSRHPTPRLSDPVSWHCGCNATGSDGCAMLEIVFSVWVQTRKEVEVDQTEGSLSLLCKSGACETG